MGNGFDIMEIIFSQGGRGSKGEIGDPGDHGLRGDPVNMLKDTEMFILQISNFRNKEKKKKGREIFLYLFFPLLSLSYLLYIFECTHYICKLF